MRSRTFREGSVGLLLLLGLGVFGLIILWINRVAAVRNSYKATVEFDNAGGMQKGAFVRYRGVKVGTISRIRPTANSVDVEIEIANSNLIMPRNVKVEANQTGLISESVIDITPNVELPSGVVKAKPLERNCDRQLIVCNNSRLKGKIGISTDELIRSSTELTTVYSSPEFYRNINKVLQTTAEAASTVAQLSRDFSLLSKSLQQEINSISTTASTIQQATNQLTRSSTRTLNQISDTTNQFSNTANQFGVTAREIRITSNQANRLIDNLDTLVTSNRSSLVATLNNITETSKELRQTVGSLTPTVNRFTQSQLLQNLETLSVNAAQASANLRDVTKTLNNPNNVLVLQQTLDSARVTFENTQKITSDLDELTGDPAFRQNLRQLVNGLSGLVSSTQQMQQQVQVATTLDSMKKSVYALNDATRTLSANSQQVKFNVSSITDKKTNKALPPTSMTLTNPTSITHLQDIQFDDTASTPVKSFDKPPQPTTSFIEMETSQENLLRQLRKHRDERELGNRG